MAGSRAEQEDGGRTGTGGAPDIGVDAGLGSAYGALTRDMELGFGVGTAPGVSLGALTGLCQ
ncbi:hypothetical protein [Streptomyces pratensis]|uniref:hypothetical protein n=1 Tax=Streptomyces pratensis TaxID=1169025 RepID=UPI0036270B75